MNLFNKIDFLKKVKIFISLWGIFFFMNNPEIIGSENKSNFLKSNLKDNQLEEIFFRNSIPYNEYDDSENQIKTFFGLHSDQSENSFYPDLVIINDSDFVREIYKSILNDIIYKVDN